MTVPSAEPLVEWILDWGEECGVVHEGNREEKRAQVIKNLGQEDQRKVRKASLYAMDTPFSQQEERETISRSLWSNSDTLQTHEKNQDWIFGIEIGKILRTGDDGGQGGQGNASGYAVDESAGAMLSPNSSGKGSGHHAAASTTDNEDIDEDNIVQEKQSECGAEENEAINPDHKATKHHKHSMSTRAQALQPYQAALQPSVLPSSSSC